MAIESPPAVGVIVQEWILVGGSLVFVILRLWVRGWLQGRLALSDLFVILAWLMNVISNMNDYLAWKYGLWNPNLTFGGSAPPLDLELYIPDPATQVKALKNLYTSSIPYYLLMYFVKGSFLLFYMKLFPRTFPRLRQAMWVTIYFTAVGLVVSMLSNIFWCWPISRNWSLDPKYQCLAATSDGPYFITVGFHVLSDLQIYALPFFLLRHLNLSRKKIIGLALVFSLGGICIIFTIARIVVVGDSVTLILLGSLGSVEITSAIMVACCPPLKWLYHSWLYRPSGGRQVSTIWRRGKKPGKSITTTSARSRSNRGWTMGRTSERTRTRTGASSMTSRTTELERERDRRRWTVTISAMDPDDGYDIMNDSEIEGTTITSRSRRSEIEMERSTAQHDHIYEEDDEDDMQDSPTIPARSAVRDENGDIMVGQRIMDQRTIDDVEAAAASDDPDRIRHCNRQDSITVGDFDNIRHSIPQRQSR